MDFENEMTARARFSSGYNGLKSGTDQKRWQHREEKLTDETLTIDGHPVMERWETAYMDKFASTVTRENGRILECGFGMGLSARAIQSRSPNEHVIVEYNTDVFKRVIAFAKTAKHPVTFLQGLTVDVATTLEAESFDGIFYDTYPLNAEGQHTHQFSFIKHAYRLLKSGGTLTYCNLTSLGQLKTNYVSWDVLFRETQLPYLLDAGVPESDIKDFVVFSVAPPETCKYYQHTTAIIPIIVKT